MKRRVKIIVEGRVQGVFFRVSTKEVADRLGLTGWVRNRQDGNVELEAEGSEEGLDDFSKWVGIGPAAARVDNLTKEYMEPTGAITFEILRR